MSGIIPSNVSQPLPLRLRRLLLASLAMLALVVGILAMHSAASSPMMGFALPVASSSVLPQSALHHEPVTGEMVGSTKAGSATAGGELASFQMNKALVFGSAVTSAIAATAITVSTATTALTSGLGHEGMLGCILLMTGCVMVLVLAASGLWLQRGALVQRIAHTENIAQFTFHAVSLPIHRPHLNVLGISRV